jgi:hypothetical protein
MANGSTLYRGKRSLEKADEERNQRETGLRAVVREARAMALVRWNIRKAPIEPLRSKICQWDSSGLFVFALALRLEVTRGWPFY